MIQTFLVNEIQSIRKNWMNETGDKPREEFLRPRVSKKSVVRHVWDQSLNRNFLSRLNHRKSEKVWATGIYWSAMTRHIFDGLNDAMIKLWNIRGHKSSVNFSFMTGNKFHSLSAKVQSTAHFFGEISGYPIEIFLVSLDDILFKSDCHQKLQKYW